MVVCLWLIGAGVCGAESARSVVVGEIFAVPITRPRVHHTRMEPLRQPCRSSPAARLAALVRSVAGADAIARASVTMPTLAPMITMIT